MPPFSRSIEHCCKHEMDAPQRKRQPCCLSRGIADQCHDRHWLGGHANLNTLGACPSYVDPQRWIRRRGSGDRTANLLDYLALYPPECDLALGYSSNDHDCNCDHRRSEPILSRNWSTVSEPIMGLDAERRQGLHGAGPWMSIFPGAAICIVVLALNLLGDGLRDAVDPREA